MQIRCFTNSAPVYVCNDMQVMYYVGVQLDITAPPTPKHDHIPAQHQSSRFQPTQDGLNQQDGFGTRDGQQSKQYQTDPQQEQVQRLAPLQSPAASEQAQHHQQPEGMSSSTDAAAEKQERQQEQPQAQQQECHEGHRQLLHRQSAPAGSSFAAAAARATMLPDVSHLHINTHASHAAQKLAGLPECGEVRRVGISVLLVTVLWNPSAALQTL